MRTGCSLLTTRHGGLWRRALLLATLLLVFALVGTVLLVISPSRRAYAHSANEWTSRSIYFIMTDRFSDGNTGNDNYGGFNTNRSDATAWHGGDFQGIINHLDYIKNMGFTAIWITPVVMQHDTHAYHGYWGYDFYSIDGHLGSMSDLQNLVTQAHNRNIWVMLDVVANHTGSYNYTAPTFPNYSNYHHNGNIQDYNNQWDLENQDVAGLNDLNQDDSTTHSTLLNNVSWLVSTTGVDGLRVDTVKHVSKSFWSNYAQSAGTFTIGEVYSGDPGYVGDYTHYLDAVLDYPMYYTIHDVFAQNKSMYEIRDRYNSDGSYRDARTNGVFIDNHDQDRFLCDASGNPAQTWDKYPQLEMALAFTFASRGIPIMYYGTEQGFSGCADPANREDLFNSFNTSGTLYNYVAKLNYARNLNAALQNGAQYEKWVDDSFYAFERENGGSNVLVALNNCWCTRTVTIPNLDNFASSQTLHDELTGTAYQLQGNSITLTLPSHQAVELTNRY
ncbi:alpha amylase catalytic region [Ktedonobacter racemifer DSM 44963]|uniref:alpha-amylase n=1 Tax=Ktedonobacter racemifer DSM 44963 TaxID=485913 RepID=D6TS94_KTERA|nr:alpha amylase catalytic region [Ktedonobacter racemifer DSM 44963]